MECLQIPVDHRLRRIIRLRRNLESSSEMGKHVQILEDFGNSLTEDDGKLIHCAELNFALDLARPNITGGVVVALLQPHESQQYQNGVVAETSRCKTLRAVKELIAVANNYWLDI